MNPITAKFKEVLNPDKLLNSVSPDKSFTKPKNVSVIYADGSKDTFTIDLDHAAFLNEWKGFHRWFAKFREAKIDELEEEKKS